MLSSGSLTCCSNLVGQPLEEEVTMASRKGTRPRRSGVLDNSKRRGRKRTMTLREEVQRPTIRRMGSSMALRTRKGGILSTKVRNERAKGEKERPLKR